ncbi:MAG TPA: hypothetical protein PLG90_01545 [Ignavibacteria bacterium]|nr:hypothetical protein [Ignavibacteria bacterium]
MKPTEDLFELINSLSKSEKRYFKIYSSLLSGNRKREINYLKLFNEIERQGKDGIYDEMKIKEKFRNENFAKQLTFTKNYLYNLIIKSLFNFYSDTSPDFESALGVFKQKYLYKKGLFGQYFKGFKTLNNNLEKFEKYGQLTDVLKFERVIVKLKRRKKKVYKTDKFFEKEKEYISKIENLTEYSKLLSKIFSFQREQGLIRTENAREKLEEIMSHNLIANENMAKSKRALEYFYLANVKLSELAGNFKECIRLSIKRYELATKNPEVFADSIINVKNESLDDILKYCLLGKDTENYKKYVDIHNKASEFKDDINKIFFVSHKYLEYLKNNETTDIKIIKEQITYINEMIKKYEDSFFKDFILEFYFWAMFYYMEFDENEKALEFSNLILNHEIKFSRIELTNLTRIFNLLIHYRLGNINLISYLIRSTEYNLKKEGIENEPEKKIIQHLKKLIKAKNLKREITILSKFKSDNIIINDRINKIFNLKNWIERIILLKTK